MNALYSIENGNNGNQHQAFRHRQKAKGQGAKTAKEATQNEAS